MKWKRLITSLLLFPVFGVLAVEGAPELTAETETETPLPETVITDIPKPDDISFEEWEGLTDDEREALNITQEQLTDEEEAAAGEIKEEDLDAVLSEDGEPAVEAPEGEVAPETVAVDVSDEDLLAFKPVVSDTELTFTEEVPAEIQTKLDALDAKLDEADKFFENQENAEGEPFTRTDLNKVNREVMKERETVNREIMQYQIKARDSQRESVAWNKEQQAFFSARTEYKEAVEGKTTVKAEAMYAALSSQVKRLNADPANAAKSGMQILLAADKAVRQAFNIPLPGKKAEATPAKPEVKKVPAAPRGAVKTLAHTPAAADNEVQPYAALMKLEGEDFIEAVEKMTPAQRDAFDHYQMGN
jgi:hypothetical protein